MVLVLRQAQDEDQLQAQRVENLILSLSKDEVFGRHGGMLIHLAPSPPSRHWRIATLSIFRG